MPNKLIKLKEVMDTLQEQDQFHISYPSIRQFYIRKSLNEDVAKYIIEKKKVQNISYYIEENNFEAFKKALYNQFT